jgi:hypothetical protein
VLPTTTSPGHRSPSLCATVPVRHLSREKSKHSHYNSVVPSRGAAKCSTGVSREAPPAANNTATQTNCREHSGVPALSAGGNNTCSPPLCSRQRFGTVRRTLTRKKAENPNTKRRPKRNPETRVQRSTCSTVPGPQVGTKESHPLRKNGVTLTTSAAGGELQKKTFLKRRGGGP